MSVTLLQQFTGSTSGQVMPAHNPLNILVSGSTASASLYFYGFEVNTYGHGLVHTHKSRPYPNTLGIFNASDVLKNYVTYDHQPTITTISSRPNSMEYCYVTVTSSYASNSLSDGDTSTGIFHIINGFTENPRVWDARPYTSGSTPATRKWLTENTASRTYYLEESASAAIFNGYIRNVANASTNYGMLIRVYPYKNLPTVWNEYWHTGSNHASYYNVLFTASAGDNPQWASIEVPVGPANINGMLKTFFRNYDEPKTPVLVSGSIIDTDTLKYEIYLNSNSDFDLTSASSAMYTVYPNGNLCTAYKPIQISWLNNLGAFEYYTFKTSVETREYTKSGYEKQLYNLVNSQTYSYLDTDRAKSIYNVKRTRRLKITSDWMTETESEFIQGLFASPTVYMFRYDINSSYEPCNVLTTSIERKLSKTTNGLISYEFDIEYSVEPNLQGN